MQQEAADLLRRAFVRIPPAPRLALLHRLGRYAPWEAQFDFTPPAPGPGEETGPPDFVGIGVQKAGTTWWYELLATHPGISRRPDLHKERHFFDRFATLPFGPDDARDYAGWFPRTPGTQSGEWTPDYLSLPWVPPLLGRAAPSTRLLVLVRDPIDRLVSGLAHQRRVGVAADGATIADALERGFYHRALARWLEHFEADQLLVLQYERCVVERDAQLAATFEHLGLDPRPLPAAEAPVTAGPGRPAAVPAELAGRLVELYQHDVAALADRWPSIDLGLWANFVHLAR